MRKNIRDEIDEIKTSVTDVYCDICSVFIGKCNSCMGESGKDQFPFGYLGGHGGPVRIIVENVMRSNDLAELCEKCYISVKSDIKNILLGKNND